MQNYIVHLFWSSDRDRMARTATDFRPQIGRPTLSLALINYSTPYNTIHDIPTINSLP
jgi:hypothetical protein